MLNSCYLSDIELKIFSLYLSFYFILTQKNLSVISRIDEHFVKHFFNFLSSANETQDYTVTYSNMLLFE